MEEGGKGLNRLWVEWCERIYIFIERERAGRGF